MSFREGFSYFWASVNRDAILPEQRITDVEARDTLVVRGTVAGDRRLHRHLHPDGGRGPRLQVQVGHPGRPAGGQRHAHLRPRRGGVQDWTGQRTTSVGDRLWWTWQLDQQRYPGWDGMVASLNASGIEVLTYINPWLVNVADKGDASIRNLSAEAAQAGYLVKNAAGQPSLMDQNGFDAALMDFTDPAARDWYADMIAEDVIGAGAAGFMADFGEGMPYDGVLFDGTPATEHNRYPQLWAQVVQEGCQPARRRTWLVHPGTKAADADLQFFLGGHLPVAPVTAQAATTVPVNSRRAPGCMCCPVSGTTATGPPTCLHP